MAKKKESRNAKKKKDSKRLIVVLSPSNNPRKKWTVVIDGKKTIHFGAPGYLDFTQHGEKKRKEAYIQRHRTREDWNDPRSAGFWAKHLLWNKETIEASIRDVEKKHRIDVKKKM